MEEIKKLKKSYAENSELFAILDKSNALASQIRKAKNKADEFHRKIQEMAKDSSYELFIQLSNKITETKKIQEDAFQKFIEHKNEYIKIAQELNIKFDSIDKLKGEIQDRKELHKLKLKERDSRILEEKTKKVEEKLKLRKRLTTEDLWVFQGQDTAN